MSAQQRLNMTVSPSPATRPKSGRLSSSLSQSTPHLAGNPSHSQANPIKKPNNSDLNYSPRLNQSVTRRNTPSRSETPKMRRQSSVTSESSTTSARELKVRPKSRKRLTKKTRQNSRDRQNVRDRQKSRPPWPYQTLPAVRC